jgi:hypothetical protein
MFLEALKRRVPGIPGPVVDVLVPIIFLTAAFFLGRWSRRPRVAAAALAEAPVDAA